MSYSCTEKAGQSLGYVMTGSATYLQGGNTWRNNKGVECFYEIGRERPDGRITAATHIACDKRGIVGAGDYAKPAGVIQIAADGKVFCWAHASAEMRDRIKERNTLLKAFANGHMFVVV